MKINILFGIGGLVIGALGGIFATKKYYEKRYNDIYEENVKIWEDQNEKRNSRNEEVNPDPVPEDGEYPRIKVGKMTDEQRAKVKEEIRKAREERKLIDYTQYYGNHDDDITPDMDADIWHQEHKDDEPSILTEAQAEKYPDFIERRNVTLYFYDDTLFDEQEETVIEYSPEGEFLFGGCLDDFYDSKDERVIVLSPQVDCIYTVTKEYASYYADGGMND